MSKRKDREDDLFSTIEESVQSPNLKGRLKYLLEWYDSKAQSNRNFYHALRTLSVLLPGAAAGLSLFTFLGGEKAIALVTGLISLVTAFVSHMMEQYRFYENWIRYRNAAEAIKTEVFLSLSGCEPYSGEQTERERQLAARVEEIAREETAGWGKLRAQQSEQVTAP